MGYLFVGPPSHHERRDLQLASTQVPFCADRTEDRGGVFLVPDWAQIAGSHGLVN
ncbi:hypothetical protein [Micromonospora andamanensis]|uniref:hypothetical protein n=1 Tax=Micromonospora andamanensis TaxID=1287068 RepID=UPI001A525B90|nr:hypothetical protein [Micromonospora andamanensis]GIJ42967.1 hypothetical protein Vwe01_62920 [Micromonospora andamanensis]